jgi:hypothetical protein
LVINQDIILGLTIGLPSSYDAVIINFDSIPADQLTLDNVISHLLNEETRQTAAATTKSISLSTHVKTDPDNAAYAATPANCDHSKVTCHFCSDECKEREKWEATKKDVAAITVIDVDGIW